MWSLVGWGCTSPLFGPWNLETLDSGWNHFRDIGHEGCPGVWPLDAPGGHLMGFHPAGAGRRVDAVLLRSLLPLPEGEVGDVQFHTQKRKEPGSDVWLAPEEAAWPDGQTEAVT